jgi:hypothetical protein
MLELLEIAKAAQQRSGLLMRSGGFQHMEFKRYRICAESSEPDGLFDWILDTKWSLDIGLNVSKTDIGFQRSKDALKLAHVMALSSLFSWI